MAKQEASSAKPAPLKSAPASASTGSGLVKRKTASADDDNGIADADDSHAHARRHRRGAALAFLRETSLGSSRRGGGRRVALIHQTVVQIALPDDDVRVENTKTFRGHGAYQLPQS